MMENKRVCKKGAQIVLSILFGIGLIGFVKGFLIGYYIGLHKARSSSAENVISD